MRVAIAAASLSLAVLAMNGLRADDACGAAGNAHFICVSESAEDLVAIPNSEWVLASGDVRAINTRTHEEVILFSAAPAFDKELYGKSCPGPLTGKEVQDGRFKSHGINLRPGSNGIHTLYVVHHPDREFIEIFQIDARGAVPKITWIGCAISPPGISGNAVTYLPNNGFAVTNFMTKSLGSYRGQEGAGLRAKFTNGEVTGEVWEWNLQTGWTKVPGSEVSGPNGVEASKDGKWYYINEWGPQKVLRLSRGVTPAQKTEVSVDFHPDNIRWQVDGSLLTAGQHGSVDAVLQECLAERNCSNVSTGVARIDPNTMKVQDVVHEYPSNQFYAAGTTGLIVGKELWVGSTYRGAKIAIFAAPK